MGLGVIEALENGVDFSFLGSKTDPLNAELGLPTSCVRDVMKDAAVFWFLLLMVYGGMYIPVFSGRGLYRHDLLRREISQQGSNGPREAKASLKAVTVVVIVKRSKGEIICARKLLI